MPEKPKLRIIEQTGETPPLPEQPEETEKKEKPKLRLLKGDGEGPKKPESESSPDFVALIAWSMKHGDKLDVAHALDVKKDLFSLGTASKINLEVAAAKAREMFKIDQYSDEDLIVWINRVTIAELQKRPGYFFALVNEVIRRAQTKS